MHLCVSALVCSPQLLGQSLPLSAFCFIFMCDGPRLLPCVGPACLPVNKCPNAPRSLSGAASLALLPVLSSCPRRFSSPSDYCVHSSRREVGVLGEQSQPSRAFHAPLSAPHDEATGPQTLHIKPAQAPGLSKAVKARLP